MDVRRRASPCLIPFKQSLSTVFSVPKESPIPTSSTNAGTKGARDDWVWARRFPRPIHRHRGERGREGIHHACRSSETSSRAANQGHRFSLSVAAQIAHQADNAQRSRAEHRFKPSPRPKRAPAVCEIPRAFHAEIARDTLFPSTCVELRLRTDRPRRYSVGHHRASQHGFVNVAVVSLIL